MRLGIVRWLRAEMVVEATTVRLGFRCAVDRGFGAARAT